MILSQKQASGQNYNSCSVKFSNFFFFTLQCLLWVCCFLQLTDIYLNFFLLIEKVYTKCSHSTIGDLSKEMEIAPSWLILIWRLSNAWLQRKCLFLRLVGKFLIFILLHKFYIWNDLKLLQRDTFTTELFNFLFWMKRCILLKVCFFFGYLFFCKTLYKPLSFFYCPCNKNDC